MKRVRLIHWNEKEARTRATRLTEAGFRVELPPPDGPSLLRALRRGPCDAVVIELSRLPMQGRDVGIALRASGATRHLPLVFVGGEADKVRRVRRSLPDAAFTTWRGIRGALRRAIASPPAEPVKPSSALAGYSGTPLPKKLGIKTGTVVGLVAGPASFERTLGPLPDGAVLRKSPRGACDLIIWFTRSRRDLSRIRKVASLARQGLWIAWPKKTSGLVTDLSESHVRGTGLANNLVDYKICAIDATWSGLKFAHRKS